MNVALLNAPTELAVANQMLDVLRGRLTEIEQGILHKKLPAEQYHERFARADELRTMIEKLNELVKRKEREA